MSRRRPGCGPCGGRGRGRRGSRAGRTASRSPRTQEPAEPPRPPRRYAISEATAHFRSGASSAFVPPRPPHERCPIRALFLLSLIGQSCGQSRKGRPGSEGIPPRSAPPARCAGRTVRRNPGKVGSGRTGLCGAMETCHPGSLEDSEVVCRSLRAPQHTHHDGSDSDCWRSLQGLTPRLPPVSFCLS